MAQTFLNDIDKNKTESLLKHTKDNSEYFNSIINNTVLQYTKHLDDLMQKLYLYIKKSSEVTTDELEKQYLELTSLLYFCGEKLEQLGIYTDLSKAAMKEVFNKSYLNAQIKDTDKRNKTTVAENTAIAEEASKYESVVNSIYDKAYKICKFKIDAGYEMVNTLRKVISRRMQEESFQYQQSKYQQ